MIPKYTQLNTTNERTVTLVAKNLAGLGDTKALLNVYIANIPTFDFGAKGQSMHPLEEGDIYACGQACGNGWRKVFNVYAKLVYAAALPTLGAKTFDSWQEYRDKKLLQVGSSTSLHFRPPAQISAKHDQQTQLDSSSIHIVMGRTYAKTLDLGDQLVWLDEEFAINKERGIIVCPYFDYRQLSNIKIVRLVGLIEQLYGYRN